MSHPRIVNVRHAEHWDLYVGRGRCPRTGRVGRWGNPYAVRRHGREAMRLFLDDLEEAHADPMCWRDLLGVIRAEMGAPLILGCWCKGVHPVCHAEVYARLADGEELASIRGDMLHRLGLQEEARSRASERLPLIHGDPGPIAAAAQAEAARKRRGPR